MNKFKKGLIDVDNVQHYFLSARLAIDATIVDNDPMMLAINGQ